MNYYIRYNNQTMGPFAEDQIINFLHQGRFNDSVRFSADLSRWYAPGEVSAFRNIPIAQAPVSPNNAKMPRYAGYSPRKNANKDHSVLFFMGFCLVAILGFAAIIYAINKGGGEGPGGGGATTEDNLAAIYQKKQQAIGVVTMTFQDKRGNFETKNIGTAFAIGKDKFVTNAHVAYGVKNLFEERFVTDWALNNLAKEAQEKGIPLDVYIQKIGDRGKAQARTRALEEIKAAGVKVRDIEIRLNHSNGKSFRVAEVQVHPKYQPETDIGEFDVAIFTIKGKTDCYFDVAGKKELHSLKAGTPVASAGFPTEGLGGLNLDKPEASYATGDIKKITDFDHKDGGPENNRHIVHSVPATGGSSGSPIFTSSGKVVAVLWGGSGHGRDFRGARIGSAALQNFAVRIDQIYDVGEPVSWSDWINDPTQNLGNNNFRRATNADTSSLVASANHQSPVNNSEQSLQKLKYIGIAFILYSGNHNDRMPSDFTPLAAGGYLGTDNFARAAKTFVATWDNISKVATRGKISDNNTSFAYFGQDCIVGRDNPGIPIVIEKPWLLPKNRDSIAVLYLGGHVGIVKIPNVANKTCEEIIKIAAQISNFENSRGYALVKKHVRAADAKAGRIAPTGTQENRAGYDNNDTSSNKTADWRIIHPHIKKLLTAIAEACHYYKNEPHKLSGVLNLSLAEWRKAKSMNVIPQDYANAVENYIALMRNMAQLGSLKDGMSQEQRLAAFQSALADGASVVRDLKTVVQKYDLESWGKIAE